MGEPRFAVHGDPAFMSRQDCKRATSARRVAPGVTLGALPVFGVLALLVACDARDTSRQAPAPPATSLPAAARNARGADYPSASANPQGPVERAPAEVDGGFGDGSGGDDDGPHAPPPMHHHPKKSGGVNL